MRRVLNGRSVVILDGKEVLAPWCLLGGAFRRHRVGGAEFVDIHRASVSSPEMYGVHSGGQDDEHGDALLDALLHMGFCYVVHFHIVCSIPSVSYVAQSDGVAENLRQRPFTAWVAARETQMKERHLHQTLQPRRVRLLESKFATSPPVTWLCEMKK